MKTRQWYRARIRWAEMVEGRGIRHWEEGLYLFRSDDREAAFRRALEIGEGGQGGGEGETRHRTRWVETRLAEVVALGLPGPGVEGGRGAAGGALDAASGDGKDRIRSQVRAGPEGAVGVEVMGLRSNFLEGPALRFALNARPTASQGEAPAGTLQKMGKAIRRKDQVRE